MYQMLTGKVPKNMNRVSITPIKQKTGRVLMKTPIKARDSQIMNNSFISNSEGKSGHNPTFSIAPNPSPPPKKPEIQVYSAMNSHKKKINLKKIAEPIESNDFE